MKLVMNERSKHRLTGLVVIVAVAVIFLPAMMKKSNQRFEENVSVSLMLPHKPVAPIVAIPNKQTMFQTVKVAHVTIPALPVGKPVSQIAKAMPLNQKPIETPHNVAKVTLPPVSPSKLARVNALKPKAVVAMKVQPKVPASTEDLKKVVVATTDALKKAGFTIQLASFTEQNNAKTLVSRLRNNGYVASYNKTNNKQGTVYKVLVGQLDQRDEALHLQKKLAANMQLNGFIVKTS